MHMKLGLLRFFWPREKFREMALRPACCSRLAKEYRLQHQEGQSPEKMGTAETGNSGTGYLVAAVEGNSNLWVAYFYLPLFEILLPLNLNPMAKGTLNIVPMVMLSLNQNLPMAKGDRARAKFHRSVF